MQWPVILKLNQEDCLFYINSQAEFDKEIHNHYLTDSEENILIDRNGHCYQLEKKLTNKSHSPQHLPLEQFNQLVRNHLSARQQCCVLKIQIESFAQGFELVKQTAED